MPSWVVLGLLAAAATDSAGTGKPTGSIDPCYTLARSGRHGDAVVCFGERVDRFAHVGAVWTDYGRALVRRTKQKGLSEETKASMRAWAMSCFDLGAWLGDPRATVYKSKVKFANPLGEDTVAVAMKREAAGKHYEAAAILCSSADAVTVDLTLAHPSPGPLIDAEKLRRVVATLRICGVVKLGNAAPGPQAELVSQILSIHGREAAGPSLDKVERWKSRFEIKLPFREPFSDPRLTMNERLLAVVRAMLGTAVEIDTFSHVTSYPGAPMQPWHTDVGASLFPGVQLPPHGLVAITPLINTSLLHGPTEFLTGSHIVQPGSQTDVWKGSEDSAPTPIVCPETEVGSMLLFDLRLRHRGRPNRSTEPRPMLYTSYVKDWFQDPLNFYRPHTRQYAALRSAAAKKLYSRLDTLQRSRDHGEALAATDRPNTATSDDDEVESCDGSATMDGAATSKRDLATDASLHI